MATRRSGASWSAAWLWPPSSTIARPAAIAAKSMKRLIAVALRCSGQPCATMCSKSPLTIAVNHGSQRDNS